MTVRPFSRRFAIIALIAAAAIVYGFNAQPNFADAYYHYNAAEQIASGNGFIDHYLWTYIGAPDSLPAPSHLYWAPGTSIVASVGVFIFGPTFAAAQLGFVVLLWAAALLGYRIGGLIGQTARLAWLTGLLVLFGGYFMRFWGTTDTFTPYLAAGAGALFIMGRALTTDDGHWRFWLLAGVLAGCGHLIRTDGLLLLFVGWLVVLWPFDWLGQHKREPLSRRVLYVLIFTAAYFVVMLPWFLRNLDAVGSPLPVGGTQGIWYTEYNDLFNYPPDAGPETLFADGPGVFIASRLQALGFSGMLGTLIAVEGFLILAPFMLFTLWRRRDDPFLRPMILFALGIHAAFTLVFPFPGMRGGLFHASAALVPFWAALGLAGLNDAVVWLARRRRMNVATARHVFSAVAVSVIALIGVSQGLAGRVAQQIPPVYAALTETLPPDARLILNDPAGLYYHTGLSGIVLPNETPETLLTLAQTYDAGYLLLEPPDVTAPLRDIPDNPPDFLQPLDFPIDGVYLYAIERDQA